VVSKAFQVLSDGNKRAIFDQTGGDPDSRASQQAASSPFSRGGGGGGMQNHFHGGGMHGEELSPEDLFRFFFGQGGAGGGASFGGGGGQFRTQFYGPGARARQNNPPQQGGPQQPQSIWLQVAPLLILVGFSILTQLPSWLSSGGVANPDFSFRPSQSFNVERTTFDSKITYHVNAPQFATHPIYLATLAANPSLGFKPTEITGTKEWKASLINHILDSKNSPLTDGTQQAKKLVAPQILRSFEKTVERSWVNQVQSRCQVRFSLLLFQLHLLIMMSFLLLDLYEQQDELNSRHERMERAKGFFGLGADWDLVRFILSFLSLSLRHSLGM
jgi:DnaJ family protein B protein 12